MSSIPFSGGPTSASLGFAQSVARLIERHGPFPPHAAMLLLAGVAEGLAEAPGSEVSGLTVSVDSSGRVRVGPPIGVPPVRSGTAGSSPFAFMAPERFPGRPGTPEGDVYALGALGFYALTGRPPFPGPSPEDFAHQHEHQGVPDLMAMRRDVPGDLAMLLYVSLAKHPTDRHESPEAFLAALNTLPLSPEERAAAMEELERFVSGRGKDDATEASPAVHRRSVVDGQRPVRPRPSVAAQQVSLAEMQRRPNRLLKRGLTALVLVGAGLYAAYRYMEMDEPKVRSSPPAPIAAPATTPEAPVAVPPEVLAPEQDPPLVQGLRAFETGRYSEAVPLLREAVRVDPEDPTPHGYLACVYRMQGRHADADRELGLIKGQHGNWDRCSSRRGG